MDDGDVLIIKVYTNGPRLGERIVTEGEFTPARECEAAADAAMQHLPFDDLPLLRRRGRAHHTWLHNHRRERA